MNTNKQQDISGLTRLVQRRQRLSRGLSWFVVACSWIGVLAVMLSLLDRLGEAAWVPWPVLTVIGAVSACAMGIWGFFRGQPGELDTAREIDGRLGLKDRLSTAIARRKVRSVFRGRHGGCRTSRGLSQTRESVRRGFPLRAPSSCGAFHFCCSLHSSSRCSDNGISSSSEREASEVNLVEVRQDASESVAATMEVIRQDPDVVRCHDGRPGAA